MTERPFGVPFAETSARGARWRQFAAVGEVPQADHALHQPHPGRQLFDALLTPVLRRLDLHHLLARFEGDLDRPSPREGRNHPAQVGIQIGGEQILVLELAFRVAEPAPPESAPGAAPWARPPETKPPATCESRRRPWLRPFAKSTVLSAAVAVGFLHGLFGRRQLGRRGPFWGLRPRLLLGCFGGTGS